MPLNTRAKKKTNDYLLFDVLYEDGARTSNRKVPTAELSGTDEDQAAKVFIEAQDRKIAEASGRPRGPVKEVVRVGR